MMVAAARSLEMGQPDLALAAISSKVGLSMPGTVEVLVRWILVTVGGTQG